MDTTNVTDACAGTSPQVVALVVGRDPHYPDGLSADAIEALLSEARVYWNKPRLMTSAVLDGSAAQRRERREARRAISAAVRALPRRAVYVAPDGEVA